jgi:hypothetical protein
MSVFSESYLGDPADKAVGSGSFMSEGPYLAWE